MPTFPPEHPMASVEEPIPPEVELDLVRYELRRGGRVERLEKLPMELLTLLAERRGGAGPPAANPPRPWGEGGVGGGGAGVNTAGVEGGRGRGGHLPSPRSSRTR